MRHPQHEGPMEDATVTGVVGNPACGDVLHLHLRMDGDIVQSASYESLGSVYQLATADVLCDCIEGRDLASAKKRSRFCVLEKLPDLPRNKQYLARLAVDALQRAIRRYEAGDEGAVTEEELDVLEGAAAQTFILDLLSAPRKWGTGEIESLARAEGVKLAPSPIRVLMQMRKDGVLTGELQVAYGAWRWWRTDLADAE